MDKEETLRLFGAALVALPPRPSLFILYFNEGSEQLTEESLRVVKTIMDDISGRTAAEVAVIGHTDSLADDAFNDRLALQRADRVKEELVRHGIPAESIAVSGRGKRELLIPTGDNVSEPRNRRVEINVR
jgi:outer membrane protein OmpA-like peptidoglycan-associated protein